MSWLGLPPEEILRRSSVLVVVGCSTNPAKAAHDVPATLLRRGFRIVPVHLTATEILGQPAFARLADVPADIEIDTVVVFRPSAQCAAVAADAVARGTKAVWLQLGLISPEARAITERADLGYVEDACSKVVAAQHDIRH